MGIWFLFLQSAMKQGMRAMGQKTMMPTTSRATPPPVRSLHLQHLLNVKKLVRRVKSLRTEDNFDRNCSRSIEHSMHIAYPVSGSMSCE